MLAPDAEEGSHGQQTVRQTGVSPIPVKTESSTSMIFMPFKRPTIKEVISNEKKASSLKTSRKMKIKLIPIPR